MSQFSGKCDFYDHLCIYCETEDDFEKLLAISEIKINSKDGREHLLRVKTIKDAVKYYPYLITLGCFSKEKHSFVLSSSSFIDREEKEHLQYDIDAVFRYWRKCKRKKIKFDEDACFDKVSWGFRNEETLREIIHRVAENGNKAEFNDIHKPIWENMRKRWYEEMVKYGYSKFEAFCWCFNEFFPSEEVIKKRLGENEWEQEDYMG